MTIAVRGLWFRYPAQSLAALDDVDLDIIPGRVTWLTGAIGSGTSTLLLAAAGLAPRLTGGERRGSVLVDDTDPARDSPLALAIGYLAPSPQLQLSGIAPTVRAELAVGPMNLGLGRQEILSRVDDALGRFDLAALADRAPSTLSGGETQRVVIAALAVAAPRTWLLDEPFSALDHGTRRMVQRILRSLADDGATVVVASEDAEAMYPLADRVVVLAHGRAVLDGVPHELLAGDAMHAHGAGTTDTAALAAAAGLPAPRAITPPALLAQIDTVATDHRAAPAAVVVDSSPVFELREVDFGYSGTSDVLRAATMTVHRGDACGLFGANGAGKSTLLRLAMALEHPRHGSVIVLDQPTVGRHPEDLAPRVAMLSQQPERQLFATTVKQECRFTAEHAGWDAARIDARVDATLHQLGLLDMGDRHPGDLPLPVRRLVALAALLVAEPELLLLDEPTAGLDDASRRRVVDMVLDRRERGVSTLVVTHDPNFAREALNRAFRVDQRAVRAVVPFEAIFDDGVLPAPATLIVARALHLKPPYDRFRDVAAALAAHRLR
ncbi:MAG: ABC transporter ATP-binding protein [Gemmatimonadales bacterium]|nr:ABC transporter ATP-binding protein [Gemmatimonadales bacterium]